MLPFRQPGKGNEMTNRTPKSRKGISRRTVLRGAGVTMALPWLESLPAFAGTATPDAFPKRFAVLFMGNGVNEDHWGAQGSGADDEAQQDSGAPGTVEAQDQRD